MTLFRPPLQTRVNSGVECLVLLLWSKLKKCIAKKFKTDLVIIKTKMLIIGLSPETKSFATCAWNNNISDALWRSPEISDFRSIHMKFFCLIQICLENLTLIIICFKILIYNFARNFYLYYSLFILLLFLYINLYFNNILIHNFY